MTTSHSRMACSVQLPILDLIQQLAINQQSVQTNEQLASFLRREIFTKLGPFSIEIYLNSLNSEDFRDFA